MKSKYWKYWRVYFIYELILSGSRNGYLPLIYCEDNVTLSHDLVFKYRHAILFKAVILNQINSFEFQQRHICQYGIFVIFFLCIKNNLKKETKQIALAQITYCRSIFRNPCLRNSSDEFIFFFSNWRAILTEVAVKLHSVKY